MPGAVAPLGPLPLAHAGSRRQAGGVHPCWAGATETHTAAVYFAGETVFKVKKPVRLDFIDLTSLEARLAACQAEVSLNRRLAPDVYLGVADIQLAGKTIDHAVVMRRLPAQSSLAARVLDHDPDLPRMVAAVVDALAAFHARCPVIGAALPHETWTPVIELFREEVGRTLPLARTPGARAQLESALALAERYAVGRQVLFEQRLNAGLVRDGHGDLQAADVYLLPDGPRILDCLEFDERLRVGDVLHDIAFLAMDLERLGRPDLSSLLLERYRTAAAEAHPSTLAHFFIAHRALVRAKVAAIRTQQQGEPADTAAVELLDLAQRHLDDAQVRVVLLGGLPGSGKTSVATALSGRLPATQVSSDRIRAELVGWTSSACGFDRGRYAPAVTEWIYTEMLRRAAHAASMGEHVVLDASWSSGAHRMAARRMAQEAGAVLVELRTSVDDSIAAVRIENRPHVPGGSEATVAVRDRMRRRFDPWIGAAVLDTNRPFDEVVASAYDVATCRSTR